MLEEKQSKLKISKIFLMILNLFGLTNYKQKTILIPKAFVESEIPKVGSAEWSLLNNSIDFKVLNFEGKLKIEKYKTDEICILLMANGYLAGNDGGEFGGGKLIYVPNDNPKNFIKIKDAAMRHIFKFKDKIYFIEGFGNMTFHSGELYELDIKDDNFNYKELVNFDDTPMAYTIYKDKILIATHKKFYILKDFKKELVFKNTFWDNLYPTSIAAFDDENIFMGVRGGIVKLDLTNKTIKFYKNAMPDEISTKINLKLQEIRNRQN